MNNYVEISKFTKGTYFLKKNFTLSHELGTFTRTNKDL